MVPVASYHAAHVVDGDLLPGFVPDVLPARDFLQHEKADFVAGVKKMTRLRIMRGANDVAPELFTQDLRVGALSASRHGLPDKWEDLMTVEAAQLNALAVQLEAVIGNLGLAETETAGVCIQQLRAAPQPHTGLVK